MVFYVQLCLIIKSRQIELSVITYEYFYFFIIRLNSINLHIIYNSKLTSAIAMLANSEGSRVQKKKCDRPRWEIGPKIDALSRETNITKKEQEFITWFIKNMIFERWNKTENGNLSKLRLHGILLVMRLRQRLFNDKTHVVI